MLLKYKYRFKTMAEFEKEFGSNWRNAVECSFVIEMDQLLGKNIPEKYYREIDGWFNISKIRCGNLYYTDSNWFNCSISKGMIKKISLIPLYKPKKFVY